MAVLKFQFKHAPGEVMALIQIFFVSSFYISVAIKVRFLKLNMFNRYKNNISKLVVVLLYLQNPWFKIAFLAFLKIELDFHEI